MQHRRRSRPELEARAGRRPAPHRVALPRRPRAAHGSSASSRALSPRFVELWDSGEPDPRREVTRHKIIEHPAVGRITLDCDTLVVAVDDLRIMVYTAEPGTEDAERLALAVVLGTQTLVG